MSRPKFFRDPLHLQMRFDATDLEKGPPSKEQLPERVSWILQKLIDSKSFQRLRFIRQNGLANLTFHGAEHTRFTHSLGVMHLAKIMYERICRNMSEKEDCDTKLQTCVAALWPAPGSEDTELGVLMEPEVDHGEAEVYTRVQA